MQPSNKGWRRIRRLAVLSVAAAGLLAAAGWTELERNKEEEYAVYSAYLSDGLLNDVHDWSVGGPVRVVIRDRTIARVNLRLRLFYLFDGRVRFAELHKLTLLSYLVRNLFQTRLQPKFELPSRAKVYFTPQSEYWSEQFYQEFPHNMGLVVLSGVGFNPSHSQAVFHIDHFCGLCGGGRYVLMEKIDGVWRVQDEHYLWVA